MGALLFCAACLTGSIFSPGASAAALDERDESYRWRLCPAGRLIPIRPGYTDPTTKPDSTEIRADSSRLVEDGINHFTGDVEIVRGNASIRAESVTYEESSGIFFAEGRAHLWNSGLIWSGESIEVNLDSEITELNEGRYWILGGRGRGIATSIVNDRQAEVSTLEQVDYSTCPLSSETWRMSASTIKLNHDSDRGSATHAVLHVRNVPVFYFPYVNFPLSDKRKSGFLAPTMGATNDDGFDTRIPFYWNIAPNMDATITPRILSDRGGMLSSEFRYLDEAFDGQALVEYLPGDNLRNETDRSFIRFEHTHQFANKRALAEIFFNNVSDNEYFEDFGGGLSQTSQRILDRNARIQYFGQRTYASAFFQAYQVVDNSIPSSSGPYRRLPQLYLVQSFKNYGNFSPILISQITHFDRDDSVSGVRARFDPYVSYRYWKTYLNIVPRIGVKHTAYFQDDPNRRFDDQESYTVPYFDLDAKFYFERDLNLFGQSVVQTLEPRLYYLMVPNIDQDDIPIYDSGLYTVSFGTIFLDNRFAGNDRVGDANQITAGVTSRILDTVNGRERFRLSVGQIYYFRDRKIRASNFLPVDDDDVSAVIAEAAGALTDDLSFRGTVQWNPNEPQTELSAVSLRYRPNLETVVNLSYRFRRATTDVEQTDISLRFPILDNIAVVGRWNYSLPRKQTLEALGGIEYESCCWGFRIVGRRFLKNDEGQYDNGAFAEIQFKGLGGFGRKSASVLRRSIPGYEDPFD